jgi:NDP-sugar pyrophosphorylase family protein
MAGPPGIDSVMVLAAGYATRLRPLTNERAKAVVPFLNRSLLDYTLDWLRRCGFEELVINLHHCADTLRGHYGDHAFGMRLRYSYEDRLLGTAGGPRAAMDALGQTTLLVNGDIAAALSLGPLIEHHHEHRALATMALYSGPEAGAYPAIPVAADGRVEGFSGGTRADGEHACFTGIHLIEREILDLVPPGRPCGIVDPIYRHLLDEDLPLHAVSLQGQWNEIGTLPRYVEAQIAALRREDYPIAFSGYQRVAPGGFKSLRAWYGRAGLELPYMLAAGVRVADGASLRGVVAAPRARIGEGALLENVVVLAGSSVGAGATLNGVVVCEDSHVPAGTVLRDGVWPVPQ